LSKLKERKWERLTEGLQILRALLEEEQRHDCVLVVAALGSIWNTFCLKLDLPHSGMNCLPVGYLKKP
jgi:hypothetical protein